jgi:hypothetical protein
MPEKHNRPGLFERVRPHLEWEIIKMCLQVGGALVIPTLYALYEKGRQVPIDWIIILGMLVMSFVLLSLAVWFTSRKNRGLSEQELNERFAQTRKEIESEVSQIIESKIHVNATAIRETRPAQVKAAEDPVESSLSQLQTDALMLSVRLLGFIEAQGPPPEPKYTKEEILRMSSAETKNLILANDKDFDFACEYYYGGNVPEGGPKTSEELQKLMMARFMLLDPWYEKVRARYALEFGSEVEQMYNRFSIEGFTDDVLRVPVQGKMGRENIRAIASKLWELAYKVSEKGISIEDS